MQIANTPMLHSKYVHLKNLSNDLATVALPPTYDYFSLASFFDACPSLETFLLDVSCRYSYLMTFVATTAKPWLWIFLLILGLAAEDGAFLNSWRSVRPEADARAAPPQAQECKDTRVHVFKEPDWADMPCCWEYNISWASYVGGPSEFF